MSIHSRLQYNILHHIYIYIYIYIVDRLQYEYIKQIHGNTQKCCDFIFTIHIEGKPFVEY